jgi:hypothetical protein
MHVICLIVLSLSISLQNKAHNPFTENDRTQHPSAHSQDHESSSGNDRLGTTYEINGQSTKTDKEKKDETFDHGFQRIYWGATILGVFGSWVLLYFVWKQGQSIINTERAWVMTDLDWTPGYRSIQMDRSDRYDNVSSQVNVRLCYRNDGNTPAWVDEIWAAFEIVEHPRQYPEITRMTRVKDRSMPYGPIPLRIRGRKYIDIALPCEGQEEIGKQNIVYGVIYYRDAFKQKRRTFFGFRLMSATEIIFLPGCPEYNKHI